MGRTFRKEDREKHRKQRRRIRSEQAIKPNKREFLLRDSTDQSTNTKDRSR